MRILIKRQRPHEDVGLRVVTLGKMFVDGDFECFTEESPMRDDNLLIAGESCLPLGLYAVSLPKSILYSRNTPLLASSQFAGPDGAIQVAMRILPGHYTLDNYSVGIIVGATLGKHNVHHTRTAFDRLVLKLDAVVRAKEEDIELGIVMEDE